MRALLDGAGAPAARARVLTAPASPGRLRSLVDTDGIDESWAWAPPEGPVFAGLGAARSEPVDKASFAAGVSRLQAILAEAERVGELPVEGPALFAGLAFDSTTGSDALWSQHGPGRVILPRWFYRRDGERATLSLVQLPGESLGEARRAELAHIEAALDDPAALTLPAVAKTDEPGPAAWTELVERALARIRGDGPEKIVLARRQGITLTAPCRAGAVFGRLAEASPGTTRFAVRRGETTFLGASPELLLARHGLAVRSEAVAGSAARRDDAGDAERAAALSKSRKDRGEHALTVRGIAEALGPFCRSLEIDPAPEVRALRHVMHLVTPVAGTLDEETPLAELVAALHPTPAVGGLPRDEALRFIAEHEPAARGWYAGPVGIVRANGDGEFRVALRSGVHRGARLELFAGAGIVLGSDAALEYEETAVKLRTMRAALGLEDDAEGGRG